MATVQEYLASLTDQVDDLVTAIKAEKGTFIIYGGSNSGKTTFMHLLQKIQHIRRAKISTLEHDRFVSKELWIDDAESFVTDPDLKLWFTTEKEPSEGMSYIHFTNHFTSNDFTFTSDFTDDFHEFVLRS